ncbi:ligand-effect modulator 3 family [Scheffersomyces xylosifermentans]|uniref:ligand-effect modulator 3 family n=1 Tax=Scheffersomyces xylosifermentans TaxID=1304137 RepID=UPI00315C62B2
MNFLRRRRTSEEDEDDNNIEDATSNIHKSRKPPNTAFRQQRLKAWQPILTPRSVIPFLFVLAVIFAPLGIAIIHTTYNVQVLSVDYSQCHDLATNKFESIPTKYTSSHFHSSSKDIDFQWRLINSTTEGSDDIVQTCYIHFNLPGNLKPPLFLYYKLTNFFQNHRKFVDSYDLEQLRGKAVSDDSVTDACKPLKHVGDKLIYPCGLIANSFFNDTISSPVLLNAKNNENNQTYEMSDQLISWPSDRDHKFRKTTYKPEDVVPPPNWAKRYPDGYTAENMPDISQDFHLQNWMRTAGLPSFFKLYGKNTTDTMISGEYEISIELNYPVTIFGGTKSIVITTNSIFGGRNMSLGVIYVIVAVIALVLGIAFLLQHLIKPRRIGDHNYLQGNSFGGDNASVGPTNFREQL